MLQTWQPRIRPSHLLASKIPSTLEGEREARVAKRWPSAPDGYIPPPLDPPEEGRGLGAKACERAQRPGRGGTRNAYPSGSFTEEERNDQPRPGWFDRSRGVSGGTSRTPSSRATPPSPPPRGHANEHTREHPAATARGGNARSSGTSARASRVPRTISVSTLPRSLSSLARSSWVEPGVAAWHRHARLPSPKPRTAFATMTPRASRTTCSGAARHASVASASRPTRAMRRIPVRGRPGAPCARLISARERWNVLEMRLTPDLGNFNFFVNLVVDHGVVHQPLDPRGLGCKGGLGPEILDKPALPIAI